MARKAAHVGLPCGGNTDVTGWAMWAVFILEDDMSYDEKKFAAFNRMVAEAQADKFDVVMVAAPWVLGDDYEEIIENLSRIAETDLQLFIVGRARP